MARLAVRLALAGALIAPACTSTQAPIARRVGQVAAIGGVIGLTASAGASAWADTSALVGAFSIISAIGIGLYAAGELTDPAYGVHEETTVEKHHRWARILTERAFRYAREGNCRRVRRVEKRVNVYDRELHDFVFMRDEAIAKCMTEPLDAPAAPRDEAGAVPVAPGDPPVPVVPPGDLPVLVVPPGDLPVPVVPPGDLPVPAVPPGDAGAPMP